MRKPKIKLYEEKPERFILLPTIEPIEYTETTEQINRITKLFNTQSTANKLIKKQKNKPLSLKPNFEDIDWQINIIVQNSKDLFISDVSQWKNLFSENITVFLKPIELRNKITISDLRLFLDNLRSSDLIKVNAFGGIIEDTSAFLYNGTVIKSKQLSDAVKQKNYPNTLNAEKVHKIFKALRLKD